ncbi:MAG: hypothetical protein MR011_00420 [Lachnospiraceae bacterium]|nr:hypothetical protein [Lachnospiraceae bacterium]
MRKKNNIKNRLIIMSLAAVLGVNTIPAYAATLGSGSQSYRISVLKAIGAADSGYDTEEICTRADFAKLLVLSSTYKDTANTLITSAAANDVASTYSGAQYIKTALTNGWMRTRLGGRFAPEEAVTLNDAVRAVIKLLGYEDSDFSSNISQERLSLFKSLKLSDGVNASKGTDTLTKRDSINIIYNLLRTNTKGGGSIYGSAIDLTLGSDGELNATNVIESNLSGPLLIKSVDELKKSIPFDLSGAAYYLNGQNSGQFGRMYLESQIRSNGWVIVYYNESARTIWAYGSDTGNNTYHCVQGKVTSIVYDNENIAAPSAVYIDSVKYTLNSSEVKFMFSLNGDIGVGDYCVLICRTTYDPNDDGEDNSNPYAVAVVKWNRNTDGSTVGTIIAENSGHYKSKAEPGSAGGANSSGSTGTESGS